MLKRLVCLAAVLLMCFICFAAITPENAFAKDDPGFVIDDYDVEIQVHDNNSMDIRETIVTDFYSEKHGIYRSIPLRLYMDASYLNGSSKEYKYDCMLSNLDVEGWNWTSEESEKIEVIKIGDPDVTVSGKQTFVISYVLTYPDDRIDDCDFICHDVLGAEWEVPIGHFSFNMKFDKKLPKSAVKNIEVYSGGMGQADNALNVKYEYDGQSISGSAQDIDAENAITVFTVLPEGYFVNEESPKAPIAGLIIALLAAVFILIRSLTTKREKPVTTVEFHAPDGMSPAEVGKVIDETADDRDLFSLVPWFAENGYIDIEYANTVDENNMDIKMMKLTKLKELPDDAPEYQKLFINALFNDESCRFMDTLDEDFVDGFAAAKQALIGMYKGEKELSKGSGMALFLSLIMAFGATIFYATSYGGDLMDTAFIGAGALAVFVVPAVLACNAIKAGTSRAKAIVKGILSAAVGLGILLFFCPISECTCSPVSYLLTIPIGVAVSMLASGMVRFTDYKLETVGKLLGLKEFIQTAEMDRLKMLLNDNPNYYFDVLPFAMAFGLENTWSRAFEKLNINRPDWYRDDSYDSFNTVLFCDSICRDVNSRITVTKEAVADARAEASSGGGGGFSGGGGGGGGGGSW